MPRRARTISRKSGSVERSSFDPACVCESNEMFLGVVTGCYFEQMFKYLKRIYIDTFIIYGYIETKKFKRFSLQIPL